MPTRKDKTNVTPIYREQVFIPASGATLLKQKARPKVAGRPVSSGVIDIISPEFDLLTLGRGLYTNLIKPNYPIGDIPIDKNSYYRQVSDIFYDKSNKLGAINDIKHSGVIRTKNSIFNSPMFAKGNIYKGYENKPNTFIIKSNNNKLDWIAVDNLGNPIDNPNSVAFTPLYNGNVNNAPSKYFDIYKYISDGKYQQIFMNNKIIPITGLNIISENIDKMKCGGRRKAQLGLDIREGGIAIPIAPNMYYMNGRSHDEGGIGIGPNNKNGLEVEGGEVVKVGDKDIKVFSSVPLLRGVSPAQLVMGGANPNKVFKAQEAFKDRNRINDDGTRYQTGGQKIYTPNESIQRQIQETGRITIGGAPTIGGLRTYGYLRGLSNVRKYGLNVNNLFTKSYNFLNRKLQNLINKNKISVNTAQKYNSAYREFVGETGQNIPKTISLMQDDDIKKAGGIYIKPSKRGTFTAAAKKRGMGVQEFASKVLANKEDYSLAMVKKANFARNASRWKKEYGGDGNILPEVVVTGKKPKTFFEKLDDYADIGEKALAVPNLALSGASLISPNPITLGGAYLTNIGGALLDLYQGGRAVYKGDWFNAGKNAIDLGLSLVGLRALRNANKLNELDKSLDASGAAREYVSKYVGRGRGKRKATFTKEKNEAITQEGIGYGSIPASTAFSMLDTNRNKKEYGGNMIYTINGNVKNGLMSARPKAQYGLASKYLKKRNKTIQKPVETKQKEEPKILDIRNTADYKIKQIAENPWIKYPVEVASYLLTGATAKGMQTGAKVVSKTVNKIDDILGKPRQEYLSRNVSDKTIKIGTIENPIRPKDSSRITKVYKPTINEISQAKQAARPKIEPKIKSIDKIYKQAIGNKEPRSTVGNVPQWTEISYTPTNRTVTAYDASVEFHKRISDMLYDSYVKKYGKKAVDKAMKHEHISKYKYGGRIKAEGGKFLKYKNGIFTDQETGEQFDVDPEVFKLYGNSFEEGVIPIADYSGGTFNARPQYYAEKRLPIAGGQSIAEKAGLARSGWSYADNEPISLNYMPNINLSIPDNYGKSSTPRRGETKSTNSKAVVKSTPTLQDTVNQITRDAIYRSNTPKIDLSKAKMPTFDVSQLGSKETKAAKTKVSTSPTGGQKEAPWIPQFNTISTGDWIGLGSNLAGHIASYFVNNALLKKAPMPIKPIMTQAAKLKTRYNINPELSETRETELVNRAASRRNTQSSNTSLAREQRIMNEARNVRNKLYGQKENIETQLINQDRLNRQSVMARNVAAYNDWLNKTYVAKSNQMLAKQQNLMGLISGIPAAVGNFLGNIDSRKATNNTIKAMAAANPNVDGRIVGIGDYYSQKLADGRVAIYDKNGKLKKYV